MPSPSAPAPAHQGHGHRTWLHLLPDDQELVLNPEQLRETAALLVAVGLASPGPQPEQLLPGPRFAQLLGGRGELPMAGAARGEVRLEVGVLRCYPDPGPQGFDTEPPRGYRAACPGCATTIDFFRLRFPFPEPLRAVCPGCGGTLDVPQLPWTPRLATARTELTFGDLVGRPSLRGTEVLARLGQLWKATVREVHVTL
ncbi:MAG: hypothetical protein ACRENY_01695 [Candidatus Dormibacteria bacterium]